MDTISLDGEHLTLAHLDQVARGEARVALDPRARARMAGCRAVLESMLARGEPIYGVNTGFGLLSEVRVDAGDLTRLQENLVRSHAAGVGEPFAAPVARAITLLRANVLARGHSAVRPEVVDALLGLLNAGLAPYIPSRGSVGASGDLAPLAHLALAAMGEGEMLADGRRIGASGALEAAGLKPLRLASREGLALLNGTQAMTASGALTLLMAERLMTQADIAGALTIDTLLGSARPFDERLAALRPHPGHADSAANVRALLEGSGLLASHAGCGKVQDSYSLRCIPQVHGSARDALSHSRRVLEIEVNAVTDNPILFPESGEAVPGGNFHGQPVALVMDLVAIALADVASISERRTDRLVNPAMSGLPAFLARRPGLESGFMMAQVTAAALASEMKGLAHPASVDSIPTGAGKEDHVSMGVTSALKAQRSVEMLAPVLAIELLCGAQALEHRRPLRSTAALEAVHAAVREKVAALNGDRVLSPDIEAVAAMLNGGLIRQAAERAAGPLR
ncbi:MAG: histidine ammonia-lyase [Candidatus Polarisedimenticolia bacterium]